MQRFTKGERKVIYYYDYIERRANLISGAVPLNFAGSSFRKHNCGTVSSICCPFNADTYCHSSHLKDLRGGAVHSRQAMIHASEYTYTAFLTFTVFLFSVSFMIHPRWLFGSFILVRFYKGYKQGRWIRNNKRLIIRAINAEFNDGLRRQTHLMACQIAAESSLNEEPGFARCVPELSPLLNPQLNNHFLWNSNTPTQEIFNVVRTITLRDWIHRNFYRNNSYPLALQRLQQCETLDDLVSVILAESFFFMKREEREREAGWFNLGSSFDSPTEHGLGGISQASRVLLEVFFPHPLKGFFSSFLDHVNSNISQFLPETCDFHGLQAN